VKGRVVEETSSGPTNLFERGVYYLGAALMLAMTGTMLYAVAARYLFSSPPIWSEDIPRLIFIWMVFLTIGLSIRTGNNIRVTMFTQRLPVRTRYLVQAVMHALVLAFLAVLFVRSFDVIALNLRGTMISTGMSNAWFSVPLAIGTGIAFVYQARLLLIALGVLTGHVAPPVEPEGEVRGSGAGLG
jgi:TRAP-type C4-dicarboxylate transport system permease small subunit